MRNVSSEFRTELDNDNHRYQMTVKMTLVDTTELTLTNVDLLSVSTDDSVSTNESLTALGSAIINQIEFSINNLEDDYSALEFDGANITATLSLTTTTGVETIPIGVYTVDETNYRGSSITIVALDNMAKFDKPYATTLIYPTSIGAIIRDACSKCDVPLAAQTFPNINYQVSAPVEECTFREVVASAAQIAGCYARVDSRGRLEIKWFDQDTLADYADIDITQPPETTGIHAFKATYSQDLSVDDVVITGISTEVKTDSELQTFLSGQVGYVLSLSENLFITSENAQEIVDFIGSKVIGLRYRKADITCFSDPTIEAGDIGIAIDRKGRRYPVLVTHSVFNVGGRQSIISAAESPARNSSTRFSELVKTYVDARKLVEKEKSDREVAEEELAKAIESSGGMFSTTVQEDTGAYTYYLHNHKKLADSDVQMRITDRAVGVTADGGEHWYGLTVDGQLVTELISTTGLSADWITTGTIDANRITLTNIFADIIQYDENNTLIDAMQNLDNKATTGIRESEARLSTEVQATKDLINGLSADVNPLLQSMVISPTDGLKMMAMGSESAVQILNDRINFLVGSQVAAYISSLGFHFDRGILTTSISIGDYMWVYDETSRHLRLIFKN